MMWRHRRFWLLLSAVLLMKDAAGQDAWDSVAQPVKAPYLHRRPEVEDFSSSVVAMETSSVVSDQDVKFSEVDVQSNWASGSQQGSSEVLIERESAGPYRSVVHRDQKFPGAVSETQLLASSSVDAWSSEPSVALETTELSSSLFKQGQLHQGSSVGLDSVSRAQGFQRPYTGSWVQKETVQSGPSHRVPSSGQTTRPPYRGPSHHPRGPQRGLPLHSRPLSKTDPGFVPQTKLSLSSLASESLGVGPARDPQQSDRWPPTWVASKWQPSNPQSEMWGSGVPSTGYDVDGDDAQKRHGFPGRPHSQDMHKGQHSGPYRPWEQSQRWGSGVPSTGYDVDGDDARKKHWFPGRPHSQDMHKGQHSGPYRPWEQSQRWGSGVPSIGYDVDGDDSRKRHGFPGRPHSQDMHKGQHSGPYRPWEQSQRWGSGVPSTGYDVDGDDARKRHGFPGRPHSQDMHKGQHSGPYRPWEQSQRWGSGVPSTGYDVDGDDARKRHGFPGRPHSQDMHKGQHPGPYRPWEQSQRWGSGVPSTGYDVDGDDVPKRHWFPGRPHSQDMHKGQHSGPYRPWEQSQRWGSGVPSTGYDVDGDDVPKRHWFPGRPHAQDMLKGQSSGPYRPPGQTAQSQV
ncbi:uncharacterized protein LOC143525617 isoform X2 [Brachyhypopomus gauderio]|uniref:uncharacterized protein LOC143525617 isoform X2 n=1 Tax=Brachyhypopomus gauderio TaxID=698409 RepID=UPI0040434CE5